MIDGEERKMTYKRTQEKAVKRALERNILHVHFIDIESNTITTTTTTTSPCPPPPHTTLLVSSLRILEPLWIRVAPFPVLSSPTFPDFPFVLAAPPLRLFPCDYNAFLAQFSLMFSSLHPRPPSRQLPLTISEPISPP